MRAVIQRVSRARVEVDTTVTGAIGAGLVVLLSIHRDDTEKDLVWMVEKIQHLRIFDDHQGFMNRSVLETNGELLVVSQFTLHGDCRKGRRPSWTASAPPELAKQLYDHFIAACRQRGIPTQAGVFQAMMEVSLINSGPVTILLDAQKTF